MDVSNAAQISEDLLLLINRGATALIADMTATISCDHAGADAVVRAYRRAVVSGTALRLVVGARIVRRVLSLSGIDRLVSIYPSVEAAMAAGTPAAVPAVVPAVVPAAVPAVVPAVVAAVVAATAGTRRNGAASTPATARKLLDALQDGVGLADGNGAFAMASRRLEEMFGYGHAELIGRPVASLIPAGVQPQPVPLQAAGAQAPWARATGAAARLTGLRKDETTFPVEISISPVTTGVGHYTLVIRDVSDAQRFEDLARAAAADQAYRSRELLDTIITSLLRVGRSLQAATGLPAEVTGQRITEAIGHLDDTIREIRDSAFANHGDDTPPRPEPLVNVGEAVAVAQEILGESAGLPRGPVPALRQ
jgi:anti-anti-sigma factor